MNVCEIVELETCPHAIASIAAWYHDEWGRPEAGGTAADVEATLRAGIDTDELPLTWVAVTADGGPVGAVQLKRREEPSLVELEYWLGGLYVKHGFRGRGVARQLIERCTDEARKRGIERLHLQTEERNVPLYERVGWVRSRKPAALTHVRPLMERAMGRHRTGG